jgi:hypothetical protein
VIDAVQPEPHAKPSSLRALALCGIEDAVEGGAPIADGVCGFLDREMGSAADPGL